MCKKKVFKRRDGVKTRNFVIFFHQTIVIFCQKISLFVFVLKRHKFCVTYTSSETHLHAHKKDDDDDEEEEEDQGF